MNPNSRKENRIEIGALQLSDNHAYDISLPLSLDSAIYPMKLDSVKAWYLFMSIVKEATPEEYQSGVCSYTFPALDFARTMNMRQPRGARVNAALAPLTRIPIQIVDADGIDVEKQKIVSTNLLMRIVYDGREKGRPITIWIDPVINNLIFHSRELINVDYKNIAMLSSVASIHVFTVLWRLHLAHIHTVDLQEFKKMLGVENKYKRFDAFAQTYIQPVEADIRLNTAYKDFRFFYQNESDNGKSIAVKEIQFSFEAPKPIQETPKFLSLDGLNPEFRKKANLLQESTQAILSQLCKEGYAVNKYMNLIMKVINHCSEKVFFTCAQQIIWDAKEKNKDLHSMYGKILTKELKKLLKDHSSTRAVVQANIRQQSFKDQQLWIQAYLKRAKEAAKGMSIDERQEILEMYSNDISQYLKKDQQLIRKDILAPRPDGRRASWRAFVSFLAEAYRTGKMQFPTSLFD